MLIVSIWTPYSTCTNEGKETWLILVSPKSSGMDASSLTEEMVAREGNRWWSIGAPVKNPHPSLDPLDLEPSVLVAVLVPNTPWRSRWGLHGAQGRSQEIQLFLFLDHPPISSHDLHWIKSAGPEPVNKEDGPDIYSSQCGVASKFDEHPFHTLIPVIYKHIKQHWTQDRAMRHPTWPFQVDKEPLTSTLWVRLACQPWIHPTVATPQSSPVGIQAETMASSWSGHILGQTQK